jgi:hypothetical protein
MAKAIQHVDRHGRYVEESDPAAAYVVNPNLEGAETFVDGLRAGSVLDDRTGDAIDSVKNRPVNIIDPLVVENVIDTTKAAVRKAR